MPREKIFRNSDTSGLIGFSPECKRQEIRDKIKKFRKENLEQRTESEDLFEKILRKLALRYIREVPVPCYGKVYFVDFLLGEPFWIAIEIDGGIHNHQEVYDAKRDCEIMELTGWTIVRIKNGLLESGGVPYVFLEALHGIIIQESQNGIGAISRDCKE